MCDNVNKMQEKNASLMAIGGSQSVNVRFFLIICWS